MKILITSGGTKIPIDSVRSITNMSSGTFGGKLAERLESEWHKIHVFRAKDSYIVDIYDSTKSFITYNDYKDGLIQYIKEVQPDIVISAAAVSDYGVKPIDGKISSDGEVNLTLYPLPKVLPLIKKEKPDTKLVGFKLLVGATRDELISAAHKQIESAGSDLVAANDLNNIRKGDRRYTMVYANGDIVEIGGENLYSDFVKMVLAL